MSDTVRIALIVSIAPTIAAFAALVVGIHNSFKANVIIEKSVEIHAQTNSNLDRVVEALRLAHVEIEALKLANGEIDVLRKLVATLPKSG